RRPTEDTRGARSISGSISSIRIRSRRRRRTGAPRGSSPAIPRATSRRRRSTAPVRIPGPDRPPASGRRPRDRGRRGTAVLRSPPGRAVPGGRRGRLREQPVVPLRGRRDARRRRREGRRRTPRRPDRGAADAALPRLPPRPAAGVPGQARGDLGNDRGQLDADYVALAAWALRQGEDLGNAEGLDADYVALAAWALSRAFVRPGRLRHADAKVSRLVEEDKRRRREDVTFFLGGGGLAGLEDGQAGNDAAYRLLDDDDIDGGEEALLGSEPRKEDGISLSRSNVVIPSSMDDITDEVLLRHPREKWQQDDGGEADDGDDGMYYEHNDGHLSNSHRFYHLRGLASEGSSTVEGLMTPRGFTPSGAGGGPGVMSPAAVHVHGLPLTLGEVAAAGISSLNARTRVDAEREMVRSPLFRQFVKAASDGGFFADSRKSSPEKKSRNGVDNDENDTEDGGERGSLSRLVYEDRYRKVVGKFQSKLAMKEQGTRYAPSPSMRGGDRFDAVDRNGVPYEDVAERQRARREAGAARVRGMRTARPPESEEEPASSPTKGSARPEIETAAADEPPPSSDEGRSPAVEAGDPPTPRTAAALPHYREAELHNGEGDAHMSEVRYRDALDAYNAALRLAPAGPDSHLYYSNRSAAHFALGDFERSIRDGERSVALAPTSNAATHVRLGEAHLSLGQDEEAADAFEAAILIDPENGRAREMLKEVRGAEVEVAKSPVESAGDGEGGRGAVWPTPFDEDGGGGGDGDGENEEVEARAMEHKDNGNSHMSSKEYERALGEYNAAIGLSPSGPNSHVYYSNRAAAYCYLAEYRLASEDCRTSIDLKPDYEKAHSRLGLSLYFLEDYRGAVEAYKASLDLDPRNKASVSYLAKAKASLAEREETERRWSRTIREETDEDEEEDDNRTGVTSTGLTSIVTAENDVIKVHESVIEVERSFEVEEDGVEVDATGQVAFDPFVMDDDEV
ncbi:hypothetical protein THAOC_02012, partial [Thalassiosira oceanica]